MSLEGFKGQSFNADEKMFRLSAQRAIDGRYIVVEMNVLQNPKLPDFLKISDAVLAVAPNLGNPRCNLKVDFLSKNPELLGSTAGLFPSSSIQPVTPPPPTSSSPSNILQKTQAFIDAAKKDGLLRPQEPIVDAYQLARAMHDDEDAQALLARMTPAQTALAAYSRHDYPLAIKLWIPLAEKGNVEAAASIASLYEYGLNGVPLDYAQAAERRRLAASEGDASSQVALGDDYLNGEGVLRDKLRAYMWLSLGHEKADKDAWNKLFPVEAAKKLDTVSAQMSAAEIDKAKAMASRCRNSNYRNCD